MHCASLHKETVAEHMVGDTPEKVEQYLSSLAYCRGKPLRYLHLLTVNVIPVFFSLLSVVWPRRLLMRLLGFTRVHKPDILQDQRRGFLCSGQCSDLLFFYFLFP